METWVRKHGLVAVLNVCAVAVLIGILRDNARPIGFISDPVLEQSGRWAIRFLLFCLAMTPLHRLFGWRWAIKLRKPSGLWAFGFGVLHAFEYLRHNLSSLNLGEFLQINYVILGISGLSILAVLAITSNKRAMKLLGKGWKRLHRLVYVGGLLVVFHALVAASSTKRGWVRDNGMAYEFKLYLVILVALLALRIPLVRHIVETAVLYLVRAWKASSPRRSDLGS